MRYLYLIGFGLVYTAVYFFLAIAAAGAGHGTYVFFAPVFTWLLVLIAVYLSGRANTAFKKILFVVCLGLHYLHVLIFVAPIISGDVDFGTLSVWQTKNGPQMFLLIAAWYLTGQAVIWFTFVKSLGRNRVE